MNESNPLLDPRSLAEHLAEIDVDKPQFGAAPEFGAVVSSFEGVEESVVAEALTNALNEGWIALWEEVASQPLVILTRKAADALRIELTQDSTRWVKRRSANLFQPHMHRLRWEEMSELKEDDRPDPRAMEPWEIAAANEEASERAEAERRGEILTDGQRAPRIWHFLGIRTQWPIVPRAGYCPLHGTKLGWNHYCLACDKSGVDHLLPTAVSPRRRAHRRGPLKGGVGAA